MGRHAMPTPAKPKPKLRDRARDASLAVLALLLARVLALFLALCVLGFRQAEPPSLAAPTLALEAYLEASAEKGDLLVRGRR